MAFPGESPSINPQAEHGSTVTGIGQDHWRKLYRFVSIPFSPPCYNGALMLSCGSEGVWEGRICYWNRRSPKSWNINKRQRGPDVPIPADIVGVQLWRAWDADVGDWAIWKHSLLAKHDLLDVYVQPILSNPPS